VNRLSAALALVLFAAAAMAAEDDWDDWDDEPDSGLIWTGFLQGGLGSRIASPHELRQLTLADLRGRAETQWVGDELTVAFKGDLLLDGVSEDTDVDLRELTLSFRPGRHTDVSLGQQVLTWGTGDLLFLNDLFPKDFQSFFAGRDDEYLKAPSPSLRVTHYTDRINVDLVWTPVFEPDRYLTGERFSFYLPPLGAIAVPEPPLDADQPDRDPGNGELALRLFTRRGAVEYALYGYLGFFKQPIAVNASGIPYHPKLSVYGASLRRPAGAGVFSTEVAWYDSRDDRSGADPTVPNSQARLLLGYERELVRNWQLGLQGYGEWTRDHDSREAPGPSSAPDELRTVLTARLTGRLRRDTLELSLFAFLSPSDRDGHLRPQVSYRLSDAWTLAGGANLFAGDDRFTFFGQLEDNNNVFARLTRYY